MRQMQKNRIGKKKKKETYVLKNSVNIFGLHIQHNINLFCLLDLPERVSVCLAWLELVECDFPVAQLSLLEKVLQSHNALFGARVEEKEEEGKRQKVSKRQIQL